MKTAFISDVHANLEALQAVLGAIAVEYPDRIVFLGDIVGYGANPHECIALIRNVADIAIAGNHDRVAADMEPDSAFNDYARIAIQWTRSMLTSQDRAYLQSLPLQVMQEEWLFVHATPEYPGAWEYIMDEEDARLNFPCFRQHVCFTGHSHYPAIFMCDPYGAVVHVQRTTIEISRDCRYIINCGSIGQPRDGNPCACYGIYDSATRIYRLERVTYDIALAQEKILEAGLPEFLARRIGVGR
ncbi:MAG: metallophosphoesterase family protein [Desulfobacterota bacterium]|nr:metallophosphoesterase family protein [Thermodesulfobacteriota bacterium]